MTTYEAQIKLMQMPLARLKEMDGEKAEKLLGFLGLRTDGWDCQLIERLEKFRAALLVANRRPRE